MHRAVPDAQWNRGGAGTVFPNIRRFTSLLPKRASVVSRSPKPHWPAGLYGSALDRRAKEPGAAPLIAEPSGCVADGHVQPLAEIAQCGLHLPDMASMQRIAETADGFFV